MFSHDGRHSRRPTGRCLAVWASVLFVALGLLLMHGIEPTGSPAGHGTHPAATVAGAASDVMGTASAPMEHVVAGAVQLSHEVAHGSAIWTCVWILVGALLLVGVFPKLGARALGEDGSRTALRVAFARAARAPPSSTRLSLVGVLLR